MNDADPLAGLDQIRWSRMRHAYGSAADVPDLLRGLVHPDPAAREIALDGMYEAVHHQGDVYPCTVALIPFLLRIAGQPDSPGRPEVIGLLADIGRAEDPVGLSGPYRKANQAVAAAFPLWERLLEDADPDVREATAQVLPACVDQSPAALRCLIGRLAHEGAGAVRAAIVRAVGVLARRDDEPVAAVRESLAGILTGDPDQGLRLEALAVLASLPGEADAPPVAGVGASLKMIDALYRAGTAGTPEAGFETDTLIGMVRRRREEADTGRRAPQAAELVRTVSAAFGDRVDDRVRLLTGLLRSSEWESRLDALYPASQLIDGRRGDYGELVELIAMQVAGHPRTRSRAVHVLRNLSALAAPAADVLVDVLTAAPVRVVPQASADETAWVVTWPNDRPSVGSALATLCGTGDERALPMLARLLDHEPMPGDIGSLIVGYGPAAAPLVPLIRRRLRDLPSGDPQDYRRDGLAYALAAIGPAASTALPELLAGPLTSGVLRALAVLASEAAECLPVLREAATGPKPDLAVPAAKALWQVSRDADTALAVARRCLDGDSEFDRRNASALLGEMGEAARPYLMHLRRLARSKDRSHWTPLSAAHAIWRVTGDPAPVLPVLESAWTANVHTRSRVAAVWAELGPAASPARDLLTAELASIRRHNVTEDTYSSGAVRDDEELLRLCRAALLTIRPPEPP